MTILHAIMHTCMHDDMISVIYLLYLLFPCTYGSLQKKNLPSFEEEVSARRIYPAIQTLDVRL